MPWLTQLIQATSITDALVTFVVSLVVTAGALVLRCRGTGRPFSGSTQTRWRALVCVGAIGLISTAAGIVLAYLNNTGTLGVVVAQKLVHSYPQILVAVIAMTTIAPSLTRKYITRDDGVAIPKWLKKALGFCSALTLPQLDRHMRIDQVTWARSEGWGDVQEQGHVSRGEISRIGRHAGAIGGTLTSLVEGDTQRTTQVKKLRDGVRRAVRESRNEDDYDKLGQNWEKAIAGLLELRGLAYIWKFDRVVNAPDQPGQPANPHE